MLVSIPGTRAYGHCGGCGRYVRWSWVVQRYVVSDPLSAMPARVDSHRCTGSFEWHWATKD